MNIAYFGSPLISALLLQKLLERKDTCYDIPVVVTQPDKPMGKRLTIEATPVKTLAIENQLFVFDKNLFTHEAHLIDILNRYKIDLCIVYAYGSYIRDQLLEKPKDGFWNIHPSLLPLYRGPSPIAYPVMLGDQVTGISLIRLTNVLDGGPIIMQQKTHIEPDEMRTDLEIRLTNMSVELLQSAIEILQNGTLDIFEQRKNKATYTKLLKKEDGFLSKSVLKKALHNAQYTLDDLPSLIKEYIENNKMTDWLSLHNNLGRIVYDYYRALHPWPGIWTIADTKQGKKRLKITQLAFKHETLVIQKVQLEGKNEVNFSQFNKAYSFI